MSSRPSADRVTLSKTVARALRHAPAEYGLDPDEEGWVPLGALLDGLRRTRRWSGVTGEDIAAMIEHSDKRRYEVRDGSIRALYGHSLPGRLAKEEDVPPDTLVHRVERWRAYFATVFYP